MTWLSKLLSPGTGDRNRPRVPFGPRVPSSISGFLFVGWMNSARQRCVAAGVESPYLWEGCYLGGWNSGSGFA